MSRLKSTLRSGLSLLPSTLQTQVNIGHLSVADTLDKWRLPMFRVTGYVGEEPRQRATLVYFGNLPQFGQWTSEILVESNAPELVQSVTPPQVLFGGGPWRDASLALYPVNPLTEGVFRRRGWRILPLYVSPVIDLRGALQDALRERSKRDRSIFRKLGLRLVVMEGESDLQEFYSSMLVPTVTRRHGVHAHVTDYSRLKEVFQTGWLIGFYDGDRWLAGHLLEPDGSKGVRSANIAWRDGSDELLRKHVVQACQYAVVEWASARGFAFFNLGSCNPFVNDGVLVYKLRYNVHLKLPQIVNINGRVEGARSYVAAKYDLASDAARAILHDVPTIEKRGGAPGVIAWGAAVPSTFQHVVEKGLPWLDLAPASLPAPER